MATSATRWKKLWKPLLELPLFSTISFIFHSCFCYIFFIFIYVSFTSGCCRSFILIRDGRWLRYHTRTLRMGTVAKSITLTWQLLDWGLTLRVGLTETRLKPTPDVDRISHYGVTQSLRIYPSVATRPLIPDLSIRCWPKLSSMTTTITMFGCQNSRS